MQNRKKHLANMWYAPPVEDKELEKSTIWQTVYQPRRISEDDWGLYCLLQYRTATAWPGCPHVLWKTWAVFSSINKTADSAWQLLLLTRIRGCHSAAALCFQYFFFVYLTGCGSLMMVIAHLNAMFDLMSKVYVDVSHWNNQRILPSPLGNWNFL